MRVKLRVCGVWFWDSQALKASNLHGIAGLLNMLASPFYEGSICKASRSLFVHLFLLTLCTYRSICLPTRVCARVHLNPSIGQYAASVSSAPC